MNAQDDLDVWTEFLQLLDKRPGDPPRLYPAGKHHRMVSFLDRHARELLPFVRIKWSPPPSRLHGSDEQAYAA